MVCGFVFVGAEVVGRAVGADRVVERFAVVEDGEPGLVVATEEVATAWAVPSSNPTRRSCGAG
jgi:hypothetical protein